MKHLKTQKTSMKNREKDLTINIGIIRIIMIISMLSLSLMIYGCSKNDQDIVSKDIAKDIYSQAPMLEDMESKGLTPSVDQRLPENPMIIQPVEKVGQYGGTWHMGMKASGDHYSFVRTIGYEGLVRFDPSWRKVIPNVAQSYEVSGDSTEFTFTLRKGMKWSDGEPFTADDIMFWYTDILTDPDMKSEVIAPEWIMTDGKVPIVTKIDDYTVKFKFSSPNSLFLQYLATPKGNEITTYPKHYLMQYHKKYNPNIDRLIVEENVSDWVGLFKKKFGPPGTVDNTLRWTHPEVPTLDAWVLETVYKEDNTTIVAVRNPYYWKVDTAGNQLPYIDTVEYYKGDVDGIAKMVVNGKIDMQQRHISDSKYKQIFTDAKDNAGYNFFEAVSSDSNIMVIGFNLNSDNLNLREIFSNKDFRIGMSYAINRQKIIDDVFKGDGTPYQAAPVPTSVYYNEKLAKQYTEYDIAKANEYLDKAGYKKGADGFRVGPDGKMINITWEYNDFYPSWNTLVPMIVADWKAVGIQVNIVKKPRAEMYADKNANKYEIGNWKGDGGYEVLLEPRWYFPFSDESLYAEKWQYWYNNPADPRGEEPPGIVKKQMELYKQVKTESDATKQEALMKELLEISADQFYVIGITIPERGFGIVKDNFHNVPKIMPYSALYPTVAPTNPCQYYISNSE